MPSLSTINRKSLNGIGRKLFLRILFLSLLISIVSTSGHLFWEYQKEITHQQEVLDDFVYTHLREITESVWVSNMLLLQLQLDGLIHSQHFQFARLTLTDLPSLSAGDPAAPHNMTRKYELEYSHNGKKIYLGTLELFLTLDHNDGSIFSKAKNLFAIQAFTVFFVSILIFYLFQHMVGRHLRRITTYTRQVSPNTLAEPLVLDSPYDRPDHEDEISILTKSINYMRENLLEDIIEREQTAIVLKKNEERMESLLDLHALQELTEQELLEHVLEEAVSLTDSQVGYLHFFNDDSTQITLNLWSKETLKSCQATEDSHYPLEKAGIWADCLRLRTPVIHNDYSLVSDKKGLPEGHFSIKRHMAVPVFNENIIVAVVGVGNKENPYDQTDVKQIQLYFSSTWAILVQKRNEKEKAKLEAKLQQAYKMDAIGTLAGGIAHDFNNILSIIIGYAEFIKEDSTDNPQIQENIKQVQGAADRAKHLVQQILAFSRKSEHELIPVRLQSLIKESIKLLRSTIPTTVEIIQNIDPQCGVVNADPTQINQILMNLCTNAVHAMDEKGVLEVVLQEIDLKPESLLDSPTSSPGKYVCLSVSDTGTGMDKKTIDRIFDPFFTTKGVGKGTGMGLSVVHGIVESHGGFITVESQMGEGSKFNVFLPVTERKEFFEVEETAPIQTGNERILIVDDEPNLVDMGKRVLESLSYKVVPETNSTRALEIFKSSPNQFDVIITDQSMPDMSGSELIAEVLKIRPDMPCILCTGFSSKVSEENAEQLGISKYINKPYSKKELGKAVREVLVGKV